MKFLDLFSGIGGFRLGLERSGHTPVGYVEIDKFARQSYQAMYNTDGEWTAEDINKVTDEEWRKFNGTVELIAGGFPCQSFSIAGKREGFLNQTKGTLFFEVARAVKQIKPRFVFLENVKGLLNHDKGNTFRTILNTLDELGYDVEWRICNSKDFGVPQNRERVYIIGHLRGDSGREVFPFFREDGEANQSTINVVGNTDKPEQTRHGDRGRVFGTDGLIGTLQASDYKEPKKILINPAKVKQIGNISSSNSFGGNPQTGRVYSNDGLSPTLNTMQGGGREPKVAIPVLTPDRVNKRQNGRRFKNDGDPSFTLTAQDRHGVIVKVKEATKKGYDTATVGDSINISQQNSKTRRGRVGHGIANTLVTGSEQATLTSEYRIRKLTPRECWRLQAFPDELFDKAQQAGLSDSQLYKQAGNSVTVNVIEYIGNLLKERE
ncbi:DNA cytosine methyltransferase [Leuconostoc mesenteroides]|uniref:DNA cytosine methyltransferase n=1 Tax=Leuconostoc mesenteroides TaxID=1245 RepID=UPI001CBB664D|nr:DNA cytosine methyltransferase [Leuconostoc mesenteroides]MBZ1508886.1 DNA cytosine methyltransferase [Leuconostoc mesenteroides]MBZ1532804.1 DNA cytosine methyltransferase [Leuconostoc mesenteroides]